MPAPVPFNITSNISYWDYQLLVYQHDAEVSRHRSAVSEQNPHPERAAFDRVMVEFSGACTRYAATIETNRANFAEANRELLPPDELQKRAPDFDRELDRSLFNPAFFLPFGHADMMSLVLVDDFDPITELTTQDDLTVETAQVAFCPRRSSFGEYGENPLFCDLDELFKERPRPAEGQFQELPFQESTPLVLFSRCKIDGLGTVGYGLLFQQALYYAMARKMVETRRDLLKPDANLDPQILNDADIRDLKCTILDLQGIEEVGVLIFARNYSAGCALLAALRTLTFRELFNSESGKLIEQALLQSKTFNKLLQICDPPRSPQDILDNCVFRWTFTTLGMAPGAFFNPSPKKLHGQVKAISEFRVSPGHDALLPTSFGTQSHLREFQVGAGDFLRTYTESNSNDRLEYIPLDDLQRAITTELKHFNVVERGDSGRTLIDRQTQLIVQVPAAVTSDIVPRFDLFEQVLPRIRDRLFALKLPQNGRTATMGRLSLDQLRKIPRQYGLPVQLRRTIENLLHHYATLLSDPFTFDAVLDLYDAFASLHKALTVDLLEVRKAELPPSSDKNPTSWRPLLDVHRVEGIAKFIEALHKAVIHRVSGAYPESPMRDMAIDLRGAVTQVLTAADASLKCGLGLLRNCVQHAHEWHPRNEVGCITAVSQVPGMRALVPNLKTKVTLSYIEADLAHILHVPSYCDYLREAARIIFPFVVRRARGALRDSPPVGIMLERVNEVFCMLLMHIFIFGNDQKAFVRYHVSAFVRHRSSDSGSDEDLISQFTEYVMRLFLATSLLPRDDDRKPLERSKWLPTSVNQMSSTEARKEFLETLDDLAPLLPGNPDYWRANRPGWRFAWDQIGWVYPKVAIYAADLWEQGLSIFRALVDRGNQWDDPQADLEEQTVKPAFAEARPLIRALYGSHLHHFKPAAGNAEDDVGLEAMTLCSAVLHQYVKRINEAFEPPKQLYLERDAFERPTYKKNDSDRLRKNWPWFEMQINRGTAAMFCPIPSWRKARLKKQISSIKTFWDISCNLKLRRLYEIVTDNWPDPEEPAPAAPPE